MPTAFVAPRSLRRSVGVETSARASSIKGQSYIPWNLSSWSIHITARPLTTTATRLVRPTPSPLFTQCTPTSVPLAPDTCTHHTAAATDHRTAIPSRNTMARPPTVPFTAAGMDPLAPTMAAVDIMAAIMAATVDHTMVARPSLSSHHPAIATIITATIITVVITDVDFSAGKVNSQR